MTRKMKQYVKERWIFCTVILSLVVLIGATVTWTAAESQIFSVKQDDGAYTAAGATSGVSVIGGFSDNTDPDSVSEGDVGALRMSANRNLFGTIRDAAGNERGVNVTASNDLETQVSAPLGSAAAAASVSIAPPTDAMFRVSDDTATNALGNPMFFEISDGTHYAEITASNDLETQVSAPLGSTTAATSVSIAPPTDAMFRVSDDTSANAIGNPMWFELTDGTHSAEITAANDLEVQISTPLGSGTAATSVSIAPPTDARFQISDDTAANTQANPIYATCSDDAAANALGNPMFFEISDGTHYAEVTASNDLEVQISAPLGSTTAATSVSIAPPTDARFQCSDDTAANALANPMFFQISDATHGAEVTATNELEIDIASQTLTAVKVSDDANANTVSNPMFTQPTNGTNGVDVLAAIADDVALTNNPMVGQCMLGLYDGATMDMGRAGASGELQVTDVAVRAGENVSDGHRDVDKVRSTPYSPAKTTTATLAAAELTLLASVEVIVYPNWTIYVKNLDGADAFTDLDIECSPDATSWLELTAANFGVVTDCVDALGAGVMCWMTCRNCSCRYVQVQATGIVAPNESSADVWITANVN